MQTEMSADNPRVYVYEAPLRAWHWINALCIVVLCFTGYFIGQPLASLSGEASDHYLMGYIRFTHFATAYVMTVGFLFRIYWAFAGNEHARQLFIPRLLDARFWDGVIHEIKWYAFIAKKPKQYIGHNPLAMLAMHFMLVWGTLFMMVTGFALYGEGTQAGSWANNLFTSWVIPLFGQSQDVHTLHRLVMWMIVCFMIVHIYAAVREKMMTGNDMVATMKNGWREYNDKG